MRFSKHTLTNIIKACHFCVQHPAFKQVSALVKESRPDPLPIVSML